MKTFVAYCFIALISLSTYSQTPPSKKDKDLEKFWQTFRTAVIGKNKFQISEMIQFPVANLICHDTELKNGMPASSKEKFNQCFFEIFSQCVRKHFKKYPSTDHLIRTKEGRYQFLINMTYKFPNGKQAGEGAVTFTFAKVQGKYKIVMIMCVGGCGGNC